MNRSKRAGSKRFPRCPDYIRRLYPDLAETERDGHPKVLEISRTR